MRKFINRNFYVDDGLKSVADSVTAVSQMRTKEALRQGGQRNAIVSHVSTVLQAFDREELAKEVKNLDLCLLKQAWGYYGT